MTLLTLLNRDSFYFGCVGDAGHYLWTEDFGHMRDFETVQQLPWGWRIDGKLCPSGQEIEGVARVDHLGGWTALAFWDRSVDTRYGSNSVFIFRGDLTFDEAVARAKEKFPRVWERFRFEVSEAP